MNVGGSPGIVLDEEAALNESHWLAAHDAIQVHLTNLGNVDPERLVETRIALHHAAQVAASLGFTFVPPRSDLRHTTLQWRDRARSLASQVGRTDAEGLRIAVAIADAELVLVDEEEGRLERWDIAGRTLNDLHDEIGRAIAHHRKLAAPVALVRPTHDLPDHLVVRGAAFEPIDVDARRELAGWFALADEVIDTVTDNLPCSGPGVCWPHHFDLATRVVIGDERSIGVGFSPGDAKNPAPYFYVTPWPYPAPEELRALDGPGTWHTEGWVGAVLTGRALLSMSVDPKKRAEALEHFVQSAIATSRELLTTRTKE